MSDRENRSGESRLRRWSRLKTQARAERDTGALPEAPAERAPGPPVPAATDASAEETSPVLEDLPDIETLDKDSDFTPFLGVDVPDELRRLALKKLWASDPVLANLDGLNDYDEDFSTLGMIAEKVSSVFKPGEGTGDPEQLQQPKEEMAEASIGAADTEDSEGEEPGSEEAGPDDRATPEPRSAATAQDAAADDPAEPTA